MIGSDVAKKVLGEALSTGADLAEIYLEDRSSLTLRLDDSKLEHAVRGTDRGAGVRVFFPFSVFVFLLSAVGIFIPK